MKGVYRDCDLCGERYNDANIAAHLKERPDGSCVCKDVCRGADVIGYRVYAEEIGGEFRPSLDDAERFCARLRKGGVPYRLVVIRQFSFDVEIRRG